MSRLLQRSESGERDRNRARPYSEEKATASWGEDDEFVNGRPLGWRAATQRLRPCHRWRGGAIQFHWFEIGLRRITLLLITTFWQGVAERSDTPTPRPETHEHETEDLDGYLYRESGDRDRGQSRSGAGTGRIRPRADAIKL